jgi:hypothetical protein
MVSSSVQGRLNGDCPFAELRIPNIENCLHNLYGPLLCPNIEVQS